MRRRTIILYAIVILIAFCAGWLMRGLSPELSCKERGGWYSERVRTCVFAEPSEAALNAARAEATSHGR